MIKFTEKLEEIFGIDIRALALMRIGFASIILIDFFSDFHYWKAFYFDAGMLPNAYASQMLKNGAFSLFLLNNSFVFQSALIILFVICTLSLLIGYRTQLCTIMVWILIGSLHNRNVLILGAEDKLLHILFFWFLFLPWGACYSVDQMRKPYIQVPLRVSSMGSAAYLLQMSFFYTFAGFIKNHPQWTTEGSSLYYVLNINEFIKPFGHSLLQYPSLLQWTTFTVLYLERFGSWFLFFPFQTTYVRLLTLAVLVSFHLGIMMCLELKFFQWICLLTLIGFLPTPFLNKILGNPPNHVTQEPVQKPSLFYLPSFLSILIAFFIVYVLFWNLGGLENSHYKVPRQMKWIGETFNLRQYWGMFGPRSMTDDGWFVIPGKLRNGQKVDIFSAKTPVQWEEPASIIELNKNYHLTLYYLNIHHKVNASYVLPWGEYLCREWNKDHDWDNQLLSLKIIFMLRDIQPNYQAPHVRKVRLLSYNCFKN